MTHSKSLKEKMTDIHNDLPRKQKELSQYILKNFDNLGLMTIKTLSLEAEVGISTIMRMLKSLGYDNFNDFKKDVYAEAVSPESRWTLKESVASRDESPTLINVWEEHVSLLNKTLNKQLTDSFNNTVEILMAARTINILGNRPYKACALYMEQLLNEFTLNVKQLSYDSETIFDRLIQLDNRDVIVVFAFEPYTTTVINTVKEAYNYGVKIILVTDFNSNPVMTYATESLKMAVSNSLFSIVPIIALIDSLVIEMGRNTSREAVDKLSELELTLRNNNITYHNEG